MICNKNAASGTAFNDAVFLSDGKKLDGGLPFKGLTFGAGESAVLRFIEERISESGMRKAHAEQPCDETSFNAVIVSRDSGYFTIGKKVKMALLEGGYSLLKDKVVFFSLDEDETNPGDVVNLLLGSVENISCIAVIGDVELLLSVIVFAEKYASADVLALPLDYSFGLALERRSDFLSSGLYLAFDDGVFLSLQKNKTADLFRKVFSERLIFVEMRVNELIGAFFDFSEIRKLINESINLCASYFKDYDYKKLVYSAIVAAVVYSRLPFTPPTRRVADILGAYDVNAESGEREYLAYKILLKIYGVAINADVDMVKIPSYVFAENEVKSLLPFAKIFPPSDYYADFERLKAITAKVFSDLTLHRLIEELTARLPHGEKIIYTVYGGRKHSVEEYTFDVKSRAVKLAPVICDGESLLKIIWAAGFTEWI